MTVLLKRGRSDVVAEDRPVSASQTAGHGPAPALRRRGLTKAAVTVDGCRRPVPGIIPRPLDVPTAK